MKKSIVCHYGFSGTSSNRLFSDGGNFSPEEVDSYKKKLEKLAIKIDSAEGFVMADLEGMEARRLEQALDIANKFEDRVRVLLWYENSASIHNVLKFVLHMYMYMYIDYVRIEINVRSNLIWNWKCSE